MTFSTPALRVRSILMLLLFVLLIVAAVLKAILLSALLALLLVILTAQSLGLVAERLIVYHLWKNGMSMNCESLIKMFPRTGSRAIARLLKKDVVSVKNGQVILVHKQDAAPM